MTSASDALQIESPAIASERHHPDQLLARYRRVRAQSETLCAPLVAEDYCIQTMPDVSPPKWHLAHVTWFFEQFVLLPYLPGYQAHDPIYDYLFNSYYETHGTPFPRPQRGLLSRPTVEQVYAYRTHVDSAMHRLFQAGLPEQQPELAFRLELGINHEQQHQELLLTDIKHILAFNPMRPAYRPDGLRAAQPAPPLGWVEFDGGVRAMGHEGDTFSYDNETPRHSVYVGDFALATRPVTNGEFLAFMDDGGYRRAELWLSDGWSTVRRERWSAPLYWEHVDGRWHYMTLAGMQPVDEHAALCHVSLYEADAYARWAGKRLPTEAEWETAAADQPIQGNLRDADPLHPGGADQQQPFAQLYGDVWEWTQSAYGPYPGFRPLAGSLGEYNGKFMSSQLVLRGGSIATPADHVRHTYRNFFYPRDRWQFTGIRLADDR